jgi:hypothetical protein
MKLHRLINGFICQIYEPQGHKHVCTEQHFHAADDEIWETECGDALDQPKVFTPQNVEIIQPGTTLVVQIIDGGEVVQIEKCDTHESAMELAIQLASEYYEPQEDWPTIKAGIVKELQETGSHNQYGLLLILKEFE